MSPATLAALGGWSALLAAVATLVGAVTLVQFFRVGGEWGRANDISSVVLMLALIPVAAVIAAIEAENVSTIALVVAGVGIVGMVLGAAFQAALVAGRGTFEGLKNRTLGAGALVGLWYVLAGFVALATDIPVALAVGAIAAGVGLVAVSYGFVVGGERHPASAVGGGVAFVGSLGFLAGFGLLLVTGQLPIPDWNV